MRAIAVAPRITEKGQCDGDGLFSYLLFIVDFICPLGLQERAFALFVTLLLLFRRTQKNTRSRKSFLCHTSLVFNLSRSALAGVPEGLVPVLGHFHQWTFAEVMVKSSSVFHRSRFLLWWIMLETWTFGDALTAVASSNFEKWFLFMDR